MWDQGWGFILFSSMIVLLDDQNIPKGQIIPGPRPATAGTSPEPCTGGRSGSGREMSVQR